MNTLQRTLIQQREIGRFPWSVERFIPRSKTFPRGHKVDLYNIIDLVSIDPVQGLIGVQACGVDFKQHLQKMFVDKRDMTELWLNCPGIGGLELIGWRKLLKKRGGKLRVWTPRIQIITLEDLKE